MKPANNVRYLLVGSGCRVLTSKPASPVDVLESKLAEAARRPVAGRATEEAWTEWSVDSKVNSWNDGVSKEALMVARGSGRNYL